MGGGVGRFVCGVIGMVGMGGFDLWYWVCFGF